MKSLFTEAVITSVDSTFVYLATTKLKVLNCLAYCKNAEGEGYVDLDREHQPQGVAESDVDKQVQY